MPGTYPSKTFSAIACESCNNGRTDGTIRYPKTIVSFAIVMLGTWRRSYELWPICVCGSMKIISTIGYVEVVVVAVLTIAVVGGECMRRVYPIISIK